MATRQALRLASRRIHHGQISPRLFSTVNHIQASQLRSNFNARPTLPRTAVVASPLLIRFQSTTSTQSIAQTLSDTNSSAGAPVKDVIYDELAGNVTTTVKPYFGYMHDLGVDFGWGTTSIVQSVIESIHVFLGGPPWWLTLTLSVMAFRAVMFPFMMRSNSQMNKLGAAGQQAQLMKKKQEEAEKAGNQIEVMQLRKAQQELLMKSGVSFPKLFLPIVIQGVVGFGIWRLGWKLSEIPQLGLSDGGLLWITNLAVSDPYFILPLMITGIMSLVSRLAAQSQGGNTPVINPAVMTYFLPALMGFVMSWQPGIVQIVILLNTAFSAGQNFLFKNTKFRERMKMAPAVKPLPELQNQGGFWANAKKQSDQLQKKKIQQRAKELEKQGGGDMEMRKKVAVAKDYERKLEQAKRRLQGTKLKEDKF